MPSFPSYSIDVCTQNTTACGLRTRRHHHRPRQQHPATTTRHRHVLPVVSGDRHPLRTFVHKFPFRPARGRPSSSTHCSTSRHLTSLYTSQRDECASSTHTPSPLVCPLPLRPRPQHAGGRAAPGARRPGRGARPGGAAHIASASAGAGRPWYPTAGGNGPNPTSISVTRARTRTRRDEPSGPSTGKFPPSLPSLTHLALVSFLCRAPSGHVFHAIPARCAERMAKFPDTPTTAATATTAKCPALAPCPTSLRLPLVRLCSTGNGPFPLSLPITIPLPVARSFPFATTHLGRDRRCHRECRGECPSAPAAHPGTPYG